MWGFVVLPADSGSPLLMAISCGGFQHEEVWRVPAFPPSKDHSNLLIVSVKLI